MLLELALLVRELALVVAERGGLLELLRLDGDSLTLRTRSISSSSSRYRGGAYIVVMMRMRDAASSIRSIALSERGWSSM